MLITRVLLYLSYCHLLSYAEDPRRCSSLFGCPRETHCLLATESLGQDPGFKIRHHTEEIWDANHVIENLYRQSTNKVTTNKNHWFLKETVTDKIGAKIYGVQCQVQKQSSNQFSFRPNFNRVSLSVPILQAFQNVWSGKSDLQAICCVFRFS